MRKFSYVGGGGTLKAPAFTLAEGATQRISVRHLCRIANRPKLQEQAQQLRLCERGRNPRHVAMLNSQRHFGFTLAEVLVTLGIIGVVSAMTVPSLMQNYQRQSYVTQLHKVYNETNQALVQYINDSNAINLSEAGLNSNAAAETFMKKYFRIVQTCDSTTNCFSDNYKSLSGADYSGVMDKNVKAFILANGASIRFNYAKSGDKLYNVAVDINGLKGPNIHGRDLFFMFIYNNGLIDDRGESAPMTEDARNTAYEEKCQKVSNIGGCFGKILNDNWEMTY